MVWTRRTRHFSIRFGTRRYLMVMYRISRHCLSGFCILRWPFPLLSSSGGVTKRMQSTDYKPNFRKLNTSHQIPANDHATGFVTGTRKKSSPMRVALRVEHLAGPEFKDTVCQNLPSHPNPIPTVIENPKTLEDLSAVVSQNLSTLGLPPATSDAFLKALNLVPGYSSPYKGKANLFAQLYATCLLRLNLNQQLKLTDVLYISGSLSVQCMEVFSQRLVNDWKSENVTRPNMLQLLFYITHNRGAPAILWEMIEDYLTKNICMQSFTEKDLHLICNAFFAGNRSIRDGELLRNIADCIRNTKEPIDFRLCAPVMKVMRHADFEQDDFYLYLADRFCSFNHGLLSVTTMAHVVTTFQAARIAHGHLLKKIAQQMETLSYHSYRPRMKDMARIVLGFYILHMESPKPLLNFLEEHVNWNDVLFKKFAISYREATFALLLNGRCPAEALNTIFSKAKLECITGKISDVSSNMLLCMNTLVKLYHPDFKYKRLDTETLSAIRCTTEKLRCRSIQYRIGLIATWLALDHLLGEEKIACHFVTDLAGVPDLEIRLDKYGCVLEAEPRHASTYQHIKEQGYNEFSQTSPDGSGILYQILGENSYHEDIPPFEHFLPGTQGDLRKIIIKVMGNKQYIKNLPKLTGLYMKEIEVLNTMGYEVLVMSYRKAEEIQQLPKEGKIDLVKREILDKLSIQTL